MRGGALVVGGTTDGLLGFFRAKESNVHSRYI